MKRKIATALALAFYSMLYHVWVVEAETKDTAFKLMAVEAGQLTPPIITYNSVELCLNSRYSQHSLSGIANNQQISNIVWAAGRVPITGSYRDIYIATPTATFLYDPNSHSLSWHSDDVTDDGAFQIIYESELDFDTGVAFVDGFVRCSPHQLASIQSVFFYHINTFHCGLVWPGKGSEREAD